MVFFLVVFGVRMFLVDADVRLRFKLASGLGEPWTRDGGIP